MPSLKRKKTPEELKREQAAFQFTREREKKAQELFQRGVPEKEARQQASASIREKREIELPEVSTKTVTAQEVAIEQQRREALTSQIGQTAPLTQEEIEALPKGVVEGSAKFGLQPAAFAGNIIGKGISKITGQEFTPQTAEELSQTGFGKALGIATTAAGLAATAGLLTAKIAATSLKAKSFFGAVGLGAIGTAPFKSQRQKVTEAKTILTESQQNMRELVTAVKQGLPPEEAIPRFNQIKRNILLSERALKQMTNNSIDAFVSGGKDELIEYRSYLDEELPLLERDLRLFINPQAPQGL